MEWKHPRDKSFLGVAMGLIIVGAFVLAYGGVAWFYNYLTSTTTNYIPSDKIIGGIVILALGYIVLELELIRHKNK